jgi:hypothetical protein
VFEEAAIRIGTIPPGFPRELLHRYIFGNHATLYLSPYDFLTNVAPMTSVLEPNKVTGGTLPPALQVDLMTQLGSSTVSSTPVKFWGRYEVGAFHGAHRTGGLGRMTLIVQADVSATSPTAWELEGTAILRPEKWDFDWEWSALFIELAKSGVSLDSKDLRGRERRTALGARIPGRPFYVAMTAPMSISQNAGETWATFMA